MEFTFNSLNFFSPRVLALVKEKAENEAEKPKFSVQPILESQKFKIQENFALGKEHFVSIVDFPRRDFPDEYIPIITKNFQGWFCSYGLGSREVEIKYDSKGELWVMKMIGKK